MKQQNGIPRITWKVLKKCHDYNQTKRQRILCLNEKYEIACDKRDNLLNKIKEILAPVDTEANINLKIATLKTDAIYQTHYVMRDTITLI